MERCSWQLEESRGARERPNRATFSPTSENHSCWKRPSIRALQEKIINPEGANAEKTGIVEKAGVDIQYPIMPKYC